MKARPWRIVWRSALVLGLALATTVGVAWAGAAFECTIDGPQIQETLRFGGFQVYDYMSAGVFTTHTSLGWDMAGKYSNTLDVSNASERGLARTPYWSRAWGAERPERPGATWASAVGEAPLRELGAGWPWRALMCDFDDATDDKASVYRAVYTPRVIGWGGGIPLHCHLRRYARSTGYQERALPLRIIWPGLGADVVLWGAVWALLLFGPGALRHAWRRRKGRCVRCGYDLAGLAGGAPCPECGPA